MKKKYCISILFSLIIGMGMNSFSSSSQSKSELKVSKVADSIYYINGQGGNMAVLIGPKGLMVVDAKFSQTAPEVLNIIGEISHLPVKFLINTHYHGDHTSGNSLIGNGCWIISHINCQKTLLKNLKPEETAESMGIPQIVYQKQIHFQFEREPVILEWFGSAHTSGDTVVVFEKSKVIHTGDLFFNGSAAYIDVKDGSDTRNWISIIKKLAGQYPDFTVVPGHGAVSTMKEWLEFADYLQFLRDGVSAAIKEGKTREQTMDSVNLGKYKHLQEKGNFITKKNNIGWVYDEMTRK